MKTDIFNWVADLLTGEHRCAKFENKQKKKVEISKDESDDAENTAVHSTDSIERKHKLMRLVADVLANTYKGQTCHFEDKILTIWIQDSLFFDLVNNDEFKEQLSSLLIDELDCAFASINISSEALPEGQCFSEIAPRIYLQVEKKKVNTKKAVISVVSDNGSLLQPEYVLDAEMLLASLLRGYNIGAGRQHLVEGYGFRENHIIIDDDVNSPQYEKNRYVSRAHARIIYSVEEGFLLYAERGGTRMAGKRTRIIRGNNKIELDNVILPEPLQDGDIIELGKSVLLLFKEVSN